MCRFLHLDEYNRNHLAKPRCFCKGLAHVTWQVVRYWLEHHLAEDRRVHLAGQQQSKRKESWVAVREEDLRRHHGQREKCFVLFDDVDVNAGSPLFIVLRVPCAAFYSNPPGLLSELILPTHVLRSVSATECERLDAVKRITHFSYVYHASDLHHPTHCLPETLFAGLMSNNGECCRFSQPRERGEGRHLAPPTGIPLTHLEVVGDEKDADFAQFNAATSSVLFYRRRQRKS